MKKFRSKIHCAFTAGIIALASSCAIQVPPTGGEKDITAPAVKKSEPENFSTNFRGDEINITFDEFISLKNVSEQLIVSPPLKNQPETRARKKTLRILLQDTLHANTTYTMYFGNSIVDLHEENPAENFQYVFSTGDVVDSLKVSGKVINALDAKTEKGLLVMLYKRDDDSLPLKTIPDYFGRTAEDGSFEINNVAPGSYKIFALGDKNSNYLFDSSEEPVAFSEAKVKAGESMTELSLFREERDQQLLKASAEEPGKVILAYAQPLSGKFLYLTDTAALKIHAIEYSEKKDSVTLWYKNLEADSLNFIVRRDTAVDSVSLRLRTFAPGKGRVKDPPVLKSQYTSGSENHLDLLKPAVLIFNHPIDSFGTEKISLKEDSLPISNAKMYFSDSLKQRFVIDFPKKENANYSVEIPASTFKDIFGLRNDTLLIGFKTKTIADYGTMAINFSQPASEQYILQLIDEKENVYRHSVIRSDTILTFEYLEPKAYRLKLIEDLNQNEEWDTGNYLQKKQPEPVQYYKETLSVRANWDVEITW